jgi:hypothetical protein
MHPRMPGSGALRARALTTHSAAAGIGSLKSGEHQTKDTTQRKTMHTRSCAKGRLTEDLRGGTNARHPGIRKIRKVWLFRPHCPPYTPWGSAAPDSTWSTAVR